VGALVIPAKTGIAIQKTQPHQAGFFIFGNASFFLSFFPGGLKKST
jgi:hypothetical protein